MRRHHCKLHISSQTSVIFERSTFPLYIVFILIRITETDFGPLVSTQLPQQCKGLGIDHRSIQRTILVAGGSRKAHQYFGCGEF
jgi:hypothetical protein